MSYENLLVYRLSVTIQDGSALFCRKFLTDTRYHRTIEQIDQANRSCKQNTCPPITLREPFTNSTKKASGKFRWVAEGYSERSIEGQLKLIGVSRASYSELREDFKDFLRLRGLKIWEKDDPRVLKVRAYREEITNSTNLTDLANWANLSLDNPEDFANLLLCLIYKESYLVDQLLRSIEADFIKNGGFRENLYKKRAEEKNKK